MLLVVDVLLDTLDVELLAAKAFKDVMAVSSKISADIESALIARFCTQNSFLWWKETVS